MLIFDDLFLKICPYGCSLGHAPYLNWDLLILILNFVFCLCYCFAHQNAYVFSLKQIAIMNFHHLNDEPFSLRNQIILPIYLFLFVLGLLLLLLLFGVRPVIKRVEFLHETLAVLRKTSSFLALHSNATGFVKQNNTIASFVDLLATSARAPDKHCPTTPGTPTVLVQYSRPKNSSCRLCADALSLLSRSSPRRYPRTGWTWPGRKQNWATLIRTSRGIHPRVSP